MLKQSDHQDIKKIHSSHSIKRNKSHSVIQNQRNQSRKQEVESEFNSQKRPVPDVPESKESNSQHQWPQAILTPDFPEESAGPPQVLNN